MQPTQRSGFEKGTECMKKNKKLPIGIEDFEKIRTEDFYYVDKTGLIKELLDNWGEVNLFTRPRRFGKSLNISMFRCFFEIGQKDSLFDGLKIQKEKELCVQYQGKFPVISVSLKGVGGMDFESAREMLCTEIQREARRFQFLADSDKLAPADKRQYLQLTDIEQSGKKMEGYILKNSILSLSMFLEKHYGCKVIILIDEYDVPLDKAFQFGYYEEMADLIRTTLLLALKGNNSLYFAVMTGCLRISKESIFTGLNHLRILSITNVRFDEYFGFTDNEVKQMLADYDLTEHYEDVKHWYDGYRFGETDVYCPWDVISYCDELCADTDAQPQEYWSNTSSNSIVKRFLLKASKQTQSEIERLIAGEFVIKEIHQELTYKELDKTIDNLWSVLFMTGYLTQRGRAKEKKYELVIPNYEIRQIFVTQIREWFQETVKKDAPKLSAFCYAFTEGDAGKIEELFNAYLKKTISIHDTAVRKENKENFYHGILLGLLSHREDWVILSNAETGEGYSDIQIEIEEMGIGIVIEVKYAENNTLDAGCQKALGQIEKNRYEETLVEHGMTTIFKYGIACYKKSCRVAAG